MANKPKGGLYGWLIGATVGMTFWQATAATIAIFPQYLTLENKKKNHNAFLGADLIADIKRSLIRFGLHRKYALTAVLFGGAFGSMIGAIVCGRNVMILRDDLFNNRGERSLGPSSSRTPYQEMIWEEEMRERERRRKSEMR